ncbi:MAG: RuvA [uncultured Acidimicrobiales bacterium]|uniref:Holliday junction branch migration complex subunit RuvA n=1 Tax=uncultured Acidimicrobiales bacterium TaxID=310071 RepID=A0A6J4GY31_9ACTN|nr:MAG: RuvA [uncultured Acidimicrobiales bacterium]
MIGRLRGTLVHRSHRGEVVLDVGGVGYRISVSPATSVALGNIGDEVVVHTHLHVREDALTLFGFATADGRDCFESLLGAHGVGPGLALAILSTHGPNELRRVVMEADLDALTLVPGVGRKTAARLLLELKSRLDVPEGAGFEADGGAGGTTGSPRADVRAALAALGYQPEEVRKAMGQLPSEGDLTTLVRTALQTLGPSR